MEIQADQPTGEKKTGIRKERREGIVEYYEKTRKDYKYLWLDKKNQAVHFGYYDETASEHSGSLSNTNRVMANLAGIHDGDEILDAGCGQGGSALWLAENFKVKVSGITLVPFQAEMASKSARDRKLLESVHFEVGDYCATPFSDQSFSVIWACESLCHADEKIRFYEEAFRLLRPGGRIIVAEYLRTGRPLSQKGEKLIHQWLDGWSIRDIDSPNEHFEHLSKSGFEDIQIQNVTEAMRPSLRRLYKMSVLLYPLGIILSALRIINSGTFKNQTSSIRLYQALKEKAWIYGMITAKKPLN